MGVDGMDEPGLVLKVGRRGPAWARAGGLIRLRRGRGSWGSRGAFCCSPELLTPSCHCSPIHSILGPALSAVLGADWGLSWCFLQRVGPGEDQLRLYLCRELLADSGLA